MTEPFFGWKKDKYDRRDWLHKYRAIPLPEEVVLSHLLSPVRDQGRVGACVGFGLGINFNSVKQKLDIYKEWCSPTYIYNGARFIEGTLSFDVGCQPRNALEWTREKGILDERFWPYNPNELDRAAPSTTRQKQANRYIGFDYYRVTEGVDGICDALATKHFVSIGNPWFKEWIDSPPCGRLPIPTMNSLIVGGHETCLYGYSKARAVFYAVNSWGEGWAEKGLFQMPFEAMEIFKARGGYDAHYVTFTAATEPPPPQPKTCCLMRFWKGIGKI